MNHLPSDILNEIYQHLPFQRLLSVRLLSHQHKNVADILLTQPRVVLQILTSDLSLQKLNDFLEFYRKSQSYKKLQKKSFEKMDGTEALCRALTSNDSQNDTSLKEMLVPFSSKPRLESQLTEPEKFLRLIDTMFWPNLGGESQRIMELIKYYRTTPAFDRLKNLKSEEMNEFEVMCYALTATDVKEIPLKRLENILQSRNVMNHNNKGLKNCLKSLNLMHRILSNMENFVSTLQQRNESEKSFLNLPRINLANLNLSNVNFSGANLEGAVFSHSTLTDISFTSAHLQNADFSEAILEVTEGKKIDMTRADLLDAKFGNNDLSNARLTQVKLFTDITSDSLKKFPLNKKTAKALVNEVLRVVHNELEPAMALTKLELAMKELNLDKFPIQQEQLSYEARLLSEKTKSKDKSLKNIKG